MHYENGNAFKTFLESVNENKKAHFFEKIGHVSYPLYQIKKRISYKHIKRSMILYLKKNVWYYYNNGHLSISLKITLQIIKMDFTQFLNLNYIKIIKDGTISILQSGRSR
jgi:hypothetical protein